MATAPTTDERVKKASLITKALRRTEVGALLGAIAIFLLFTATDTTGNFAQLPGMAGWTDIAAPIGIVAIAVALLMIAGEFDLSAGVMVGTTGLVIGMLVSELGLNIWLAIVIAIIFAAGIGFVNGYLVVTTKLPSFIITLATFFILKGANFAFTMIVTGSVRVTGVEKADGYADAQAIFASTFKIGDQNFQISLLWWLFITILATFLLTRTKFGNWIFAAGGDANAARNAGVPVARTKIALFMGTAVAAALVGVIFVLRLKGMQAGQGVGQEFYYIIAAAVGGTLLTGGAGSAIGASIGAIIMGMAYIGIPFSLWNSDWTSTFLGVILFSAVMINTYIGRKAAGGKR
jgi:simple sugar transport system permease protein